MAAINYDDERFAEVEADKQQALTENEQLYNGMINQSDQHYQQQIEASKEWGEKQQQIQQEQTDFAIEQIEQQKEQAEKDYKKEQSGAYVDWKKQSGAYGADAEQMAASGLAHTGYSETTKAGMWNTYQNRMAVARESYNQAVLNFNNSITEARLQNSSAQAEIAYNTLLQQLQLSLEGFQYHNSLVLDQANRKQEIDSTYYSRYQDVVNQINQEKALEEQKRQYDLDMAWQREQLAYQKEQDRKSYDLQILQMQQQQDEQQAVIDKTQQIKTQYYNGPIADNVGGFGYMAKDDNGVAYQPKGVEIYGTAYKLSKSGKTAGEVYGKDVKNSSGVNIKNQNIWKATDKNGVSYYYIWNGTKNEYEYLGNFLG